MQKQYIDPGQLLEASFSLGLQIHDSGFVPDYLLGVWRGGTPVATAVHELLYLLGHRPDHFAVKTASYTGIDAREETVAVEGLDWLLARLRKGQAVLLVDDIFDTGRTFETLRRRITDCGLEDIDTRVGAAWWKPANNLTSFEPDYYVHRTGEWLVFPHELEGLSEEELRAHKPALAPLMNRISEILRTRNENHRTNMQQNRV